jgi:hypothetical protein
VSSGDHFADDFSHQGIRQDHRKARRARQLLAMRFHETDAVKQQRFGAPACKRNASCSDDVQRVRGAGPCAADLYGLAPHNRGLVGAEIG